MTSRWRNSAVGTLVLLFLLSAPSLVYSQPEATPTNSTAANETATNSTAANASETPKPEAEVEVESKLPDATKESLVNATYVGSAECKDCHEDQAQAFGRTLHSKVKGWAPEKEMACESCHGPGSIHLQRVEAKAPPDLGLRRINNMDSNEASQVCLKCHESQHAQADWRFSRHAAANLSCLSCHNPHPDKKDALASQLRDRDPQLCYQCHQEEQAQVHWPSRHPIREGRMKCGDCHNVHGGDQTGYKNAPNARELCLSCHAQYRGPFVTGHAPAQDSCLDCHRAHGSVENNLLVASEPFLCLRCHSIVHNPHQAAATLQNPLFQSQTLFFTRCSTCHTQVHGSNIGPSLTR